MEPAVKVEHVEKDEHDCNHARPALHCVAKIAGISISIDVALTALNNPYTDQSVENNRQEDKRPLNHSQEFTERVNLVDVVLEGTRARLPATN